MFVAVEASILLNTKDRVLGSRQDIFNKNLLKWIGIILAVVLSCVIVAACLYQHKRKSMNPLEELKIRHAKDDVKVFDVHAALATHQAEQTTLGRQYNADGHLVST